MLPRLDYQWVEQCWEYRAERSVGRHAHDRESHEGGGLGEQQGYWDEDSAGEGGGPEEQVPPVITTGPGYGVPERQYPSHGG